MATKKRTATPPPPQSPIMPVLSPDSVTPAEAWRTGAKEGFVIELPSGKRARVKRTMNLLTMLEKGKIPNPLAGRMREMIAERKAMPELKGDDASEAVPQLLDLVAAQVKRNFVEPRVEEEPADWDEETDGEWEPSEGAISLEDVDMQDRMYAFAFAQGMALDLEKFRRQQATALATVQNVAGLATNPSGPAVPDRPVPGVVSERGGVDVRQPRRAPDERSGERSGQAKPAKSRKAASARTSTEGPGDQDEGQDSDT